MTLPGFLRDRFLSAIRRVIAAEFPQLAYAGLWEYAVTSVNDDGTINGMPTDATITLPAMNRVPLRALACGGLSEPTVGSRFLVEFGNMDGTKYACVGVDPTVRVATIDATGTVSMGVQAPCNLGPGEDEIARNGDSITVWFPQGTLAGDLTPEGGGPVIKIPTANDPGPLQILNPAPGLIVGGTSRVRA